MSLSDLFLLFTVLWSLFLLLVAYMSITCVLFIWERCRVGCFQHMFPSHFQGCALPSVRTMQHLPMQWVPQQLQLLAEELLHSHKEVGG